MKELLSKVRQRLLDQSDEKKILSSDRYFKEGERAKVYGVPAGVVGKIGKEVFREIKNQPKQEMYALCDELWRSLYFEEAYLACVLTKSLHKQYEQKDLAIFENWLGSYVNNWAGCDTLCTTTIGPFLMKFPEQTERLKEWATSPNRWLRRGAAVSLIVPAEKGHFQDEVFAIADLLMTDEDDLVQKGYGWMLKDACKFFENEVFDYVVKHKAVMPRTALRYAIEKMPEARKAEVMKK